MAPPPDIRAMADQLNKDFDRAGVKAHVSGNVSSTDFANELLGIIHQCIAGKPDALQNLLYVVDVSEIALGKLIAAQKGTPEEAITWLLLKRTWEKIESRKKFANF
ncbi:MAG: hypothetical protein RQ735_04925 [Flavobacteriaceae bacterium]|nr:hypothetical protein [Flavobacteriaceae bacterium]